jgi:hypothetical protein
MQFRQSQDTEPDDAHFPIERGRNGNRGGKSNLLNFQKENGEAWLGGKNDS